MASPDPLAVSDTEIPKRCSSRGCADLLDKNNEFTAALAVIHLHISASVSGQNHPTKWLFECLWWRTATNTPGQAFFHLYPLWIHQPAVPMLRVKSRHISCQAVYLLRCCGTFIVYHPVLHTPYDLGYVVIRNSHLKVTPCKILKMIFTVNH